MAGSHPDPPSYRMAWHVDGTQVFDTSTGIQLSEADMRSLNSESGSRNITSNELVFIFPELRDFDAIWLNGSNTQTVSVAVSVNSTNGVDGVWTVGPSVTITPDGGDPLGPRWRDNVVSSTTFGIKALRLTVTNLRNVHIYGEIIPEVTEKRVEFWHPTLNQKQPPNWFDWGNTPLQSTDQVAFRLKNMSPALTAHDVVVSMEALTTTVPSVRGQHFLSVDGSHWASTVDVGDISPDGLSPVAYLRRVTPSNADMTPPHWAVILKPVPTFWS